MTHQRTYTHTTHSLSLSSPPSSRTRRYEWTYGDSFIYTPSNSLFISRVPLRHGYTGCLHIFSRLAEGRFYTDSCRVQINSERTNDELRPDFKLRTDCGRSRHAAETAWRGDERTSCTVRLPPVAVPKSADLLHLYEFSALRKSFCWKWYLLC